MPIDLETLEKEGKDVEIAERKSRKPEVLAFLKENSDSAYTQAEIAAQFGFQSPHAHSVLKGLVNDGTVEKKQAPGLNAKGKEQDLIYYHYIEGSDEEEEPAE